TPQDIPPTWAALAAELKAPPEAALTSVYRTQYDSLLPAQKRTVMYVHVNVAKAIAAYEWLLSSDHSSFDQFVNEGPQSPALSPAAKRGLKLFVGKASCMDCHKTPLFSDGKFHNIGIEQRGTAVPTIAECSDKQSAPDCDCVSGKSCLPWGAYFGTAKLRDQAFSRRSEYSDDPALRLQPGSMDPIPERLMGAWRTPSLRDVAMTGPYMHNGIFTTLSDVIWHYDQAGGRGDQSGSELSGLGLSAGDREDLAAFLSSLTGTPSTKLLPFNDGGMIHADGGIEAMPDPGQTIADDASVDALGIQPDAGANGDGR
ncbi:MAG: hypothetical protein H7X95_14515, partial [Deltaproteobacteria bacterium]|nr:hypothetical protein [Deltaproteobacteria bacterium]